MSSASGSVGPLAASATIFALMRGAFSAVITFSSAAGTSTSQSIFEHLVVVDALAAGEADDRPGLELVRDEPLDVESLGVRDAAAGESETATML